MTTFHLLDVPMSRVANPGTLMTVPVEMNFADGTKAAIRRSSRALSEEELEAVIGGAISTTTQMVSSQIFVRSTLNHFFPLPPSSC